MNNLTIDHKLKIIFGVLSPILLITLIIKLLNVPGGMILPGWFLGGIWLFGIIIICLILAGILKLIFKKSSFETLFLITTSLSFLGFHYYLYSPTLSIKVPNGYKGEINLVLSNVKENILTVDSNGIGYINEWTFNKTYTKPIVTQMDGKNLDKRIIEFSYLSFWKQSVEGVGIRSLNCEIASDDTLKQKQYYSKDFRRFVNKKLVLYTGSKK